MQPLPVALRPEGVKPFLADAVEDGGGMLVDPADAAVLVWTDPDDPDGLRRVLGEAPQIEWVQLPWAGIEPYLDVIGEDRDRTWTAGQGVYAEPVAEHALALALAGMRGVGHYARRGAWSPPRGRNLLGASVVLLGAGGIAASLLRLLGPFGADVTVVRNRAQEPLEGADRVVGLDLLHDVLGDADLVVLALALTDETEHVVDAAALAAMPAHAWLVNVARGRHVDTGALLEALADGSIGGAALDVTEPEPLPEDHPLWARDDVIVTPHVGNTPEMAEPLLSRRVAENLRRYRDDRPLLGVVDPERGY